MISKVIFWLTLTNLRYISFSSITQILKYLIILSIIIIIIWSKNKTNIEQLNKINMNAIGTKVEIEVDL